MQCLNLGILAHVDAGKTTLTEQLLHAAGVIDEVGRVDDGTTRTDSLALERQRGITIKSAVVSFVVGDTTVNLIDTPGHPDFIAEVDRALAVLDGAVLVVSAVEGVQPQTLLLFRALRRLGVPTLLFVNKIDRAGADVDRVLDAVRRRLHVEVLRDGAGAAATDEVLAGNDDEIMRHYVEGAPITAAARRAALLREVAAVQLLPVFCGAALVGLGVDRLLAAIPELLPAAAAAVDEPPSGTVFKIERGPSHEKIAVARMVAGTLRARDRIELGLVTGVDVFERGAVVRGGVARAGQIVRLHGLASARIGDTFGPAAQQATPQTFAPPTLETAVVARFEHDKRAAFAALSDLAEQDPLIDLRQDDARGELFLSLYGEVQREVIAQTLLAEHGLEIEFRPTTPVCIERPNRPAAAVEHLRRGRTPHHPFLATVGLAVSPLPPGSGITFALDVDVKSIPIHVFDDVETFRALMDQTVRETLSQGLYGWSVTDCHVAMTDCGFMAPPRKWPGTTLSDYRLLTPLVLMAALKSAGTTVLEPVLGFRLEVPAGDLGAVMGRLAEVDAQPGSPTSDGNVAVLEGTIRVARLHQLQSRLPDLSHGEGVLESSFAGYTPVQGPLPSRPRTDRNPLDRTDYLRRVRG